MDFLSKVGGLALGSRLRRLSDRLFQDVSQIYASLGINLNPRYFPLFYLIYTEGAQSITGAAKHLYVSHAAISKLANEMLKEQLLSKQPDPEDERRQLLTLGPAGLALLSQLEPVWAELRQELNQRLDAQQYPLLRALDEFEFSLQALPLEQAVCARCQRPDQQTIEIIDWDPAYRDDFYQLNMHWLQRYFADQLYERDNDQLAHPERYYLARGGIILFARSGQQIIGCCALERYSDDCYYLTKTAVSDAWQGKGVGRKLVLAALDKARHRGAKEINLETASCLASANHLYRQLGFVQVTPPDGEMEFPRADIFMTLSL